jgi:hypothetical protein
MTGKEGQMLKASHNALVFKIEYVNPEIGAYLYVYQGEDCIRDHLQNDVETCKEQAFEEYGVPLNKWIESVEK